jgi:hypothetical protein
METLEILAGLSFIYMVLSLVCTAANELVAQLINLRGKTLRTGLRTLIEGPETRSLIKRLRRRTTKVDSATRLDKASSPTVELYNHPLIAGLRPTSLLAGSRLPSYIPPGTFAMVLLDLVAPAETGLPKSIERLKQEARGLPPQLQKSLSVLIEQAGNSVQELQLQISRWFSDAMERVSGVYKRRTQLIILAIAVLTTVGTNADTIRIWRSLSSDATIRAAVLSAAENYSQRPRPVPQTSMTPDTTGAALSLAIASLDSAVARIDSVTAFGVPLGWRDAELEWLTVPGWLITALAISLGAPFWFDVLNKIMNVRAAGRAPEEKPKPPEALPPPRGA